jgi:hypothetical integral membrane protein (TIGR02206 family)
MNLIYFRLFDSLHLIVLAFLFITSFFILRFNIKYIDKILAIALIIQVLAFNIFYLSTNSYIITQYLPFHLCTISAFLAIIALITKSKFFINILIFWGLIPAFLAILLPDIGPNDGILTFRFWEFFTSHIVIVLSSIYFLKKSEIEVVKIWLRQALKAYFVLFFFSLIFILPLNLILGSNYMYIMSRSRFGIDFIPSGIWHAPTLFILTFIVFIIQALAIYLVKKIFKSIKANSLQEQINS